MCASKLNICRNMPQKGKRYQKRRDEKRKSSEKVTEFSIIQARAGVRQPSLKAFLKNQETLSIGTVRPTVPSGNRSRERLQEPLHGLQHKIRAPQAHQGEVVGHLRPKDQGGADAQAHVVRAAQGQGYVVRQHQLMMQ